MNKELTKNKNLHITLYTMMLVLALLALFFAVLNYFELGSLYLVLAITFFTAFYHFFIRFFVAVITYYPLRHLQNTENVWLRQKEFEPALYAKINVHKWKKYMPTYTPAKFDLRKHSPSEIIKETCRAEINHLLVIPLCFFPVFWSLWWDALPVFLITSVISAFMEVPFVIMQRYNRPRLKKLAARFDNAKGKMYC